MATQTPTFTQTMSDPQFKAYVKEGTVSKLGGVTGASNLATLSEIGKVGLDIHKSMAMANLEKLQQGEIDEYLSKSPTKALEVEQEAMALQGVMGQLDQNTLVPLEEGQTMEDFDAKYSAVQAEHAKKLAFLDNAAKQGVITAEMFAERVIKNTREAVAKNPGLTKELMASSQSVLNLSGIQGRLEQDTKLATLQAAQETKELNDLLQEANIRNIPSYKYTDPNGAINKNKLIVLRDEHRAQEAAYITNQRAATEEKNLNESEIQHLVRSGIIGGTTNYAINKLEQDLTNLYTDDTIDFAKKSEMATRMILNAEQRLVNPDFSYIAKYTEVPAVKEALTNFSKQAEQFHVAIRDAKDGTTAAKNIKNLRDLRQDKQMLGLLEKVDLASVNFITDTFQKIGPAAYTTPDGIALKSSLIKMMDNLVSGIPLSEKDHEKDSGTNNNVSKVTALLEATAKTSAQAAPEKRAESASIFNRIWGGSLSSIFDTKVTKTPKDAFTRMDEINNILKDPAVAESWKQLDEDTRSKLNTMIEDYNDQVAASFASYIKDHPNENIKLSMLPDGTLTSTGGSTTFNKDLLGRVNAGLKAYANLAGTTTERVRDEFYTDFYAAAFADQATFLESRGSKFNITNVVDPSTNKAREFTTLEAGVQYNQQKVLDIYATGKKSVFSIVNELRPESSRTNSNFVTQKDYITQIAKNMGVKEREILDLNKPYVMSNLLSSIAEVEGKHISIGRVSDALTKPPLPASTQAYWAAQRAAGEQRQQIYNGVAQFFRPVSELIDKGLATIGGVAIELGTMPTKLAWDMDYYHKTGELKHKYETQGVLPNINKIVTKVIAPIESGNVHIDPKTDKPIESSKGAKGITQVLPKTGRNPGYGVAPLPEGASEAQYIKFSEGYFGAMVKLFKGDTSKALAAYNAGPGAVQDAIDIAGPAWLVALPTETKDYVLKARLREANLLFGEK